MNELTAVMRPDVAEAIRLAKENLPPYPTALCEELGAFIGPGNKDRWRQGKPCFAGWVWFVGGCPNGMIPNNVSVSLEDGDLPYGDFDPSDIGYTGLWTARIQGTEQPIVWCAIPSLAHGRCNPGQAVDIGLKRVGIGMSSSELNELLREGWRAVMEMIAEYGEFIPGEP